MCTSISNEFLATSKIPATPIVELIKNRSVSSKALKNFNCKILFTNLIGKNRFLKTLDIETLMFLLTTSLVVWLIGLKILI